MTFCLKQPQRPVSVPSGHVTHDGTAAKRGSVSEPDGGQDHQRGTGGLASQLWTHTSVQTSHQTASKGPCCGPRLGYARATVVLGERHSGIEHGELSQRTLLCSCLSCWKYSITPCKQAHGWLQILGHKHEAGSVFLQCLLDFGLNWRHKSACHTCR